MIISEDQAAELLNSETNLALSLRRERPGAGNRVNHENAGRNEGDNNLSPELRAIIAAAAHVSTAKEVASNFNVSPSHAHSLKHGRVTTEGETKPELVDKTTKILEKVREDAASLILKSLGLIDNDEKLAKSTPRELASMAKDLSHVVEKATPKEKDLSKDDRVIIITVPQRTMEDYQTVDAIPIESSIVED